MGNRVSGGMLTPHEGDKFRGGYPSGYTSITTAFPFMGYGLKSLFVNTLFVDPTEGCIHLIQH